jgi:RNA recognition motif-containing protein
LCGGCCGCWLLLQNFGEFGPVRRIHIVPAKTIAFIKYHWRVSAEFAREALDQQQLTGSTLNEVRMCCYSGTGHCSC